MTAADTALTGPVFSEEDNDDGAYDDDEAKTAAVIYYFTLSCFSSCYHLCSLS